MNLHTFLDNYTVAVGAMLLGNRKFFSRSVESPGFSELLQAISIGKLMISGEGSYEVEVDTLIGPINPAFYIAQWLGSDYPTLIYHHGNNERPFDFGVFSKNTFKSIFMNRKTAFPANLIVLRAPFHQSLRIYSEKIRELVNFATMLAVSVKLIEELQVLIRQQSSQCIVVCGISLGGWVTNIHRAYFNSADLYLPMLAGAALDEVFLSSAYRKMTATLAHNHPEKIRQTLNFEAPFSQITSDNVFPLLARYDPIIEYNRQKRSYDERLLTVIDKGHTTTVLDNNTLREFLLSHLQQL